MKMRLARYMAVAAAVPALLLGGLGVARAQPQPTDPPQTENAPADVAGMVQACERHMEQMAPQMESMMESMTQMGNMMQPGSMGSMMGGANSMMRSR